MLALHTECLVVFVYNDGTLVPMSGDKAIDNLYELQSYIEESGDMSGKVGSMLLIRDVPLNVPTFASDRILLIGIGAPGPINNAKFKKTIPTMCKAISTLGAASVHIPVSFALVEDYDMLEAMRDFVSLSEDHIYRSDLMKSGEVEQTTGVNQVTFLTSNKVTSAIEESLLNSMAIAKGVMVTKQLGDLPSNICTPKYLGEQVKDLAEHGNFDAVVLGRKKIKELNMGSFLAVAKGSSIAPKLIVIRHMAGDPNSRPIVLVGKGITFDSGGISLKPGANMDEMKYDMCGAATVIGVFRAIAEMKIPLNIIGIIPACENMPGPTATKPGDIVTSMSGKTIEVLNTDAEGRMVLCDALTYAERFDPETVIDIATLTGACVTSLGSHNSGLFTRHDDKHDSLASELLVAGEQTGDTVWRMPIDDRYQEQLNSNFADVANIGGGGGGSITAACFLERFTKKYTWAHLDIAGTAWKSGAKKGATGRPVQLLCQFLLNRVKASK